MRDWFFEQKVGFCHSVQRNARVSCPTQWAESLNQADVGGGISAASKIDWVTNTHQTTSTVQKVAV